MKPLPVFPVPSETACLLKWAWSSLYLYSGDSNSCHRTTRSHMSPQELGTFHNTPEKLEQRQQMLRGEWPAPGNGCDYCEDIERAGGMSDRLTTLAMLRDDPDAHHLVPSELHDDPTACSVTPTMLEVYFTNRCNMSCVYCGPNYSTQWVAENHRHGTLPHHGHQLSWDDAGRLDQQYPGRLRAFWQWMEAHSSSLRMFHVLGGEPFFQRETEEVIRFWHDHPNPLVHIKIFSNLKVGQPRFRQLMAELKALHDLGRCRSVGIVASLDGWGVEQEYVRHGLDLAQWEENCEHLVYEHPWACVSVNSTINALTLRTMPDLLERVLRWDAERARRHAADTTRRGVSLVFNLLTGPPFLRAANFPRGFFDTAFDRLFALHPQHNAWERGNVEYLRGLQRVIDAAPHQPARIAELKATLDILDGRRGTDWQSTFPWLVDVS